MQIRKTHLNVIKICLQGAALKRKIELFLMSTNNATLKIFSVLAIFVVFKNTFLLNETKIFVAN
jgi:hypothetical protein